MLFAETGRKDGRELWYWLTKRRVKGTEALVTRVVDFALEHGAVEHACLLCEYEVVLHASRERVQRGFVF